MRMNVDPDKLLPKLPSAKELRPFPTGIAIEYDCLFLVSLLTFWKKDIWVTLILFGRWIFLLMVSGW
jgi:hypothetical protein